METHVELVQKTDEYTDVDVFLKDRYGEWCLRMSRDNKLEVVQPGTVLYAAAGDDFDERDNVPPYVLKAFEDAMPEVIRVMKEV